MSGKNPLERLVQAAEEAAGEDDVRASTFIRGLALGALVGAAVAGSTIWQRRHARGTELPSAPDDTDAPTAIDTGGLPTE